VSDRAYKTAAVAALAVGVICLGHSAWIYAKALVAQRLIEGAWQRAAQGDLAAKPWPWADTRPVAKLILGHGADALMVLEGSSGRNLAFGPAHDPATVLPGERGNSVIEGHRDTHFSVLKDLGVGDLIRVELAGGQVESFVVAHAQVADSRFSRIALDSPAARLILVTCYPFDAVQPGGPLRYVVTADHIVAGQLDADQISESSNSANSPGLLSQPAAAQSLGPRPPDD
jgi:sortase A